MARASTALSPAPHTDLPSWLKQFERWFGLITQQTIRRSSFDSVTDLKRKIDNSVTHYNEHPRTFMWTSAADSMLAKVERLCDLSTEHHTSLAGFQRTLRSAAVSNDRRQALRQVADVALIYAGNIDAPVARQVNVPLVAESLYLQR